jgi:hypothetical protein
VLFQKNLVVYQQRDKTKNCASTRPPTLGEFDGAKNHGMSEINEVHLPELEPYRLTVPNYTTSASSCS